MLVGILSDTHDRTQRAERAVDRLKSAGAEYLIHCGDFTSAEVVHICGVLPFACVLGNCDHDEVAIRNAVEGVGGTYLDRGGSVIVGGKQFAVTHGDDAATFRSLILERPDYLLFGHTHVALDERDGPTHQINPGALHRAARYTVVLLDTELDATTFLTID